jgi:predicted nucleic acid-binding protein
VASTLWKRAIRGLIPAQTAELLFEKFSNLRFPLEPIEDSIATAFELALRYRHPVDDCLYAALALRKRWEIVTADERFFNAFHSLMGRQVRLLRDWG